MNMEYGYRKEVELGFEEAVSKVKESLNDQDFGVLTEINVKETLKQKLGIETDDYIILGACNPNYAHKALEIEKDLGLLLPCNVIVYIDNGKTVIAVISPKKMLEVSGNPSLGKIAEEVESKMIEFLDSLEGVRK